MRTLLTLAMLGISIAVTRAQSPGEARLQQRYESQCRDGDSGEPVASGCTKLIADLRQRLTLGPSPWLQRTLGLALLQQARYKNGGGEADWQKFEAEGVQYLETALKLKPGWVDCLHDLALQGPETARTEQYLEEAVRLAPTRKDIHLLRITRSLNLGQVDKAHQVYSQYRAAIPINPDDELRDDVSVALFLFRSGKVEWSAEVLRHLLTAFSKDPEAQCRLCDDPAMKDLADRAPSERLSVCVSRCFTPQTLVRPLTFTDPAQRDEWEKIFSGLVPSQIINVPVLKVYAKYLSAQGKTDDLLAVLDQYIARESDASFRCWGLAMVLGEVSITPPKGSLVSRTRAACPVKVQ